MAAATTSPFSRPPLHPPTNFPAVRVEEPLLGERLFFLAKECFHTRGAVRTGREIAGFAHSRQGGEAGVWFCNA
jgi:hypothetical protein